MGFRNFISKFLCCCRGKNPRVSPLSTPTVEGPRPAAGVTPKSSRSAGDDTEAVVTSRDPPTTTKIFNCNSTEDKHNKETDHHPVILNNKFKSAEIKPDTKPNPEENVGDSSSVVEDKPQLDQSAALTSQAKDKQEMTISDPPFESKIKSPETVNIGISSQKDASESESTSTKRLRKWDDFDYSLPYDFYRRDPSVIDEIEPEPDQQLVDLTENSQIIHYMLPGSIPMTDSDYTPILKPSPPTNSSPKDDNSVQPIQSSVASNSDESPSPVPECPVMGDAENKTTQQVVQISAPEKKQIDISHTHEPPVPVSECSVLGENNYLPVVKNSHESNLYSKDIIPAQPVKPVPVPYTDAPILSPQCPDFSETVTDESAIVLRPVPRNLYLKDSIYRQPIPVQPIRQSLISFNHGETDVESPVRPESPKTPVPIRKNRDIIYDKFGVPETTSSKLEVGSSNTQIPKRSRSIYFNESVEFASFRELSDERTNGFQRTYDMLKLEGPLHKIMSRRSKAKQLELDELLVKRLQKVIDPVVKIVQEPEPGGVGQGPPSKTRSRREKVEPLDELLVKRLEKVIGPAVKIVQEPEPGDVGLVEEPETPEEPSPPPKLEVKNLPKKSDRGHQFRSIIDDLKRSIKEAQDKTDHDNPEELDEVMEQEEDLEEAKDKDKRSLEDHGQ